MKEADGPSFGKAFKGLPNDGSSVAGGLLGHYIADALAIG